jgi:Holliday junction resolvase-like predicted endonuclease
MKSEIKVILGDEATNKAQGSCFENLVRNILSAHQYEVKSNINFTGMEIDLIANHKINKEALYVECKAKEKVSSTEIRNFAFNVSHKKADKGYFIRTKELESQAGGLIEEMKEDDRYKNLTFIEPKEVIQILVDANYIKNPSFNSTELKITKRILCITHFGDFFVYILTKNSVIPTHYAVFNTKGNTTAIDDSAVNQIKNDTEEISNLIRYEETITPSNVENKEDDVETISEVQESENWFDYLPASSKDFVGRDKIRNSIFDFFNNVLKKQTNRRVFYLTGKSGWGKSSLVAEIRGRSRNKHYKRKYFAYAVDTRSATSQNFVAIAFKGLISKAITDGFIDSNLSSEQLSFTSNQDLLSSSSVKLILDYLKKKNRLLILIFDQFEDVFRKQGLFKSFYKFLSDITDYKSNIIVGFSWKTEILIPSENEAYHYWQQAKEQSIQFVVPEFAGKEIDGVIKQLEGSVGKLNQDLKRRIKENSQGLPWLTKKLCIHVYEQIQNGIKPDKLIDENLNIEELFKSDLEKINSDEAAALKYIATRAYEGTFFDISDLGDKINESIIESLRDKRLIIRSGVYYNIYWDIFRDYIVTNKVPLIGESYILRQGVNLCLEVFLLFENSPNKVSIEYLLNNFSRKIEQATLENILIDLRSVGLVHKIDNEEVYRIAVKDMPITKKSFVDFMEARFRNYTPYHKLLKKKTVTKDDVIEVFKEIFKYDFKEKTWDTYAKTFIGWIQSTDLELKNRMQNPQRGRRSKREISEDRCDIIVNMSKNEFASVFGRLKKKNNIKSTFERDLFILGFMSKEGHLTDKGTHLLSQSENDAVNIMKLSILELPKLKLLSNILNENSEKKSVKEIVCMLPVDFFSSQIKESSKVIYLSKLLTWLR